MNTCRNGICPKWYVGNAVRDVLVNDENVQRAVGNNIVPINKIKNTIKSSHANRITVFLLAILIPIIVTTPAK